MLDRQHTAQQRRSSGHDVVAMIQTFMNILTVIIIIMRSDSFNRNSKQGWKKPSFLSFYVFSFFLIF